MDKFPLLLEGRLAGELTIEREALYTWLTARCPLPDGLWCAWVVGEQSALRLGVLEPHGSCGEIRRRVSHRLTAPLGRILRGEVRPNGNPPDAACRTARELPQELWNPAPMPEKLFRTPWLRQRLQGRQGVLACFESAESRQAGQTTPAPERKGFRLALPWDPKQPFPLPPLFCFAELRSIEQARYLVFCFDGGEQPVFEL